MAVVFNRINRLKNMKEEVTIYCLPTTLSTDMLANFSSVKALVRKE